MVLFLKYEPKDIIIACAGLIYGPLSSLAVSLVVSFAEMITVSDTGIGIAPEDLPCIFEKGFTGYNGRAEKKSTGLGMYLSRRAADMLGHTLSVQSAPGAGSTFSLDMKESNLQVE